jgi:phage gp46-like protein
MAQDWSIDPKTGDWVIEKGSPIETDSLLVPAYYDLKIQKGKWLYATAKEGSEFHTIKKNPTVGGKKIMENIGEKALQVMLDDGRASSITVTAEAPARGVFDLTTKIVDAQGNVDKTTFKGIGS